MIKEVKMFTIICDNCGVDCNKDAEYSCWSDKGYAEDCARDADWYCENDKHYCNNCWSYDDNDEIVLKKISNETNS